MATTANINFGFRDLRTNAELILAPGRPLSVSVLSGGNIKLGPFSLDAVGAISTAIGAKGLSPATFTRFRAQLESKKQIKALGVSVNASLQAYNSAVQLLLQGQTTLRDLTIFGTGTLTPSSATGAVSTFFSAADLVQLSGFGSGEFTSASVKAAASAQLSARGAQLTAFAGSIAAAAGNFKFFGAQIKENFNRQPRPTDEELDAPSTPAMARGGAAAEKDTARKTKKELTSRGIKTAIAKPKSWVRDVSTKKEPLRSYKLTPGYSNITRMVFASDNASQPAASEPLAPFNPQFPYNKSTVTDGGHLFELDDTPGASRVHLYHRSGSNIEMQDDGTVVYKSVGGRYAVTHGDDIVKIEGKCQIHVDSDVSVYAKGNVNIQSDKAVNINTAEDFTVHAKNINLRAKRTSTIDGTTIDLRYVKLPGTPVMTPSGLAPRLIAGALKADYPDATTKIAAQMAVDRKLSTAYRKRVLTGLATAVTAASVAAASRDMLRLVEYTQFGSFTPNFRWPPLIQPWVLGPTPQQNPLSNPLIYSAKTDAAKAYRGRLFDTPDEVNNIELYQAHIDTRRALSDISQSGIAIPGERTTPILARTQRTTPRAVIYPNRDAFRNTSVQPSVRLGNSSFTLGDLVDVFHSPEVANFITASEPLQDRYVDPITGAVTLPPSEGGGTGGGQGAGGSTEGELKYIDIDYWIRKARSTSDTFSDGKCRIGWNQYWEDRLIQGLSGGDCASASVPSDVPSYTCCQTNSNNCDPEKVAAQFGIDIRPETIRQQIIDAIRRADTEGRLGLPNRGKNPETDKYYHYCADE